MRSGRCTCGRFRDVGVESAKRFDPSFRRACVFDPSPAAFARRACERRRHGGSRFRDVDLPSDRPTSFYLDDPVP